MTLSTDQTNIELLFIRLRWPIARVRWQATQEIVKLLRQNSTAAQAKHQLLEEIRNAELTSEVLPLLEIVYAFELTDLFEEVELREAVRSPSVLSDYLISRMFDNGYEIATWLWEHSGAPPDNFKVHGYFRRKVHEVIPPIFDYNLKHLEEKSNKPFVRQWEYEWQCLMDEGDFPYSSFPRFFVHPYRRDEAGMYDTRQREVFITAYLKALHVGMVVWGLPRDFAITLALAALSISKGLCGLNIGAPSADVDEAQKELSSKIDSSAIANLASRSLTLGGSDQMVLSVDLQGMEENERTCELSARVSFAKSKPSKSSSEKLKPLFEYRGDFQINEPFEFIGEYHSEGISDCVKTLDDLEVIPATVFPHSSGMGRYQLDLLHREIQLPRQFLSEETIELKPNLNGLSLLSDGRELGSWTAWATGWRTSGSKNASPGIGTLTLFSRAKVHEFCAKNELVPFVMIRWRTWARDNDYGETQFTERYEVV